MDKLKKNIRRVLSVNWIKSLFMNLYYFGFINSLRFPLLVGYGVRINSLGARNSVEAPMVFGSICFALKADPFNMGNRHSYWHISDGAKAVFKGTFRVSKGTVMHLFQDAQFIVGDGFSANANLLISCSEKITIGEQCLLGWDITLMDSEGGHSILRADIMEPMTKSKPIIIGNHVWLGAESSILKGTEIGDGCVVGFKSNVCGIKVKSNNIIAGNPAKIIKEGYTWKG